MRIPLEFYNYLRDNLRVSDIVRQSVVLTKKGAEYSGICPFHDEKTPSFTVNDAKQFYHCFGCGAHGDIVKFVSETSGLTYKEAAIKIANDNGIALPKISKEQERQYKESDQIYEILELARQFFESNLNSNTRTYLNNRGITDQTIKDFSIGYSPGKNDLEKFFENKSISLRDLLKSGLVGKRDDGTIYEIFKNRIMFPIKNIYNKTIGFGGRAIGDNMPKYINSPETIVFKKSETMYGENTAISSSHKTNYAIIVEGYLDVISLHQAGFKQAVASLGTAVTKGHIQKLWRSCDEIISCLDGDNAGIRAQNRLIKLALPEISGSKNICFARLPDGMDPDDVVKSKGKKELEKIIDARISMSEMIWQNETNGKTFKTAESRAILENKFAEYYNLLSDRTLKINYRQYFKDLIWNNLIKRPKVTGRKNEGVKLGSEVQSTKKYSEIDYLERAICSFLLKYPEVASDIELLEDIENINFTNDELRDFKDWMISILAKKSENISDLLKKEIKNTGFYDTYLVLSSPGVLFLDLSFVEEDHLKQERIFKWLCKKHYLLLLKKEHTDMIMENIENAGSKSSFYLAEIQKVSQELASLSEEFIN